MTQTVDDLRLDGNAAAGLLQELFAFEITTAITICEGCGRASPVGALLFYGQHLGAVLRCPAAEANAAAGRPSASLWSRSQAAKPEGPRCATGFSLCFVFGEKGCQPRQQDSKRRQLASIEFVGFDQRYEMVQDLRKGFGKVLGKIRGLVDHNWRYSHTSSALHAHPRPLWHW